MADEIDNNASVMAKNWIDTLIRKNQWRVEVLSKRYRSSKSTKSKRAPLRIRRFAEGCPPSQMKIAMDYLLSLAPYTGVVFNGEVLPGTYRPTLTMWKRDDQEIIHTVKTKVDGTYTLVQDLIDADHKDSYGAGSSVSCSEEVVSDWNWDAEDVEDLPDAEQGVTWSIQAMRRNDDGTFDYSLVKRRAITQHMDMVTVKSTETELHAAESWNNLYGNPETGFLNDRGEQVDIPAAGTHDGTTTELQVTENDDCTYRVTASYSTSFPKTMEQMSTHTQFEGHHSASAVNSEAPLPVAPDASGGVIKTNTSQLQPDSKYSNKQDVVVERPVSSSVVEVTRGRKGTRRTVEDRNQSSPASLTEVADGGTVRVEKTPGGLYNNRVTSWTDKSTSKVGDMCEKDIFHHSHRITKAGATMPTGDVTRSVGQIVTRTTEMDDDGAITQSTETKTEQPVEYHRESWKVGLTGVVHTVQDTQVANGHSSPSYTVENVGKELSNEKTPGGRVTRQKTEIIRSKETLTAGRSSAATVFETDVGTVTHKPLGTIPTTVVTAGDGHVRKTDTRLNSDGSSTTSDSDTTEHPVKASSKRVRKTAKAIITTVTDRNVTTTATIPVGIGEQSHEMTPGGLYNHTSTSVNVTGNPDKAAASATVFETSRTTQSVKMSNSPSVSDVTAGGGVYRDQVSTVDDFGICTTETKVTTEKPVRSSEVRYRRTRKSLSTTIVDRNVNDTARAPDGIGCESSHVTNPGGTRTVTTTMMSVNPGSSDYASSEQNLYESQRTTQTCKAAPTADQKQITGGSGGIYRKFVSTVDDLGIQSNNTTEITERQVSESSVEYTSDYLSKTSRRTDTNCRSKARTKGFTAEGADLVTDEHKQTPGGLYIHTETTKTPSPMRSWDTPDVDFNYLYQRITYFRNATKAQMKEQIQKVQDAFKQKLDMWGNQKRYPGSISVSPSTSMNEFGLFDGSVTVRAVWDCTSAGQTGSMDIYFVKRQYTIVSFTQRSEALPNKKVRITRAYTKRKVHLEIGRGKNYFDNLCQGEVYEGSSFSFSPSTSAYSVQIVKSVQTGQVETEVKNA